MRKLTPLLIVAACGVFIFAATSIVRAATSATVTSTVTIQNVSVGVTSGTVNYGTLAVGATLSTIQLGSTQIVTNSGNVAEDFVVAGQNSTNWTLAGTPAADTYVHKFSSNAGGAWTALTTSNQALGTNIGVGSTVSLDLQITAPSSSTVTTQQNVNVSVLATAH